MSEREVKRVTTEVLLDVPGVDWSNGVVLRESSVEFAIAVLLLKSNDDSTDVMFDGVLKLRDTTVDCVTKVMVDLNNELDMDERPEVVFDGVLKLRDTNVDGVTKVLVDLNNELDMDERTEVVFDGVVKLPDTTVDCVTKLLVDLSNELDKDERTEVAFGGVLKLRDKIVDCVTKDELVEWMNEVDIDESTAVELVIKP